MPPKFSLNIPHKKVLVAPKGELTAAKKRKENGGVPRKHRKLSSVRRTSSLELVILEKIVTHLISSSLKKRFMFMWILKSFMQHSSAIRRHHN